MSECETLVYIVSSGKKKSEIGVLFVLTPPFLDISPPANIKMYVLRGHYIEVLFD